MKQYDVLCIGDAAIDLTIAVPRRPGHDDKVLGKKLSEQVGGTVTNCACVCASLGLKVASVANVGDDKDGQRILDEYRRYGLSLDYVNVIKGMEAFKVLAMLDQSGEKSIVLLPAEPVPYSLSDLQQAMQNSRYVYMMPGDIVFLEKVRSHCAEHNCKLVVDIEHTLFDTQAQLDTILNCADIAMFNQQGYKKGFAQLPSKSSLQALAQRFDLDGICVTLGEKGAMACVHDQYASMPGFSVQVVDTTGAGDTFNAAFLYALINQYDLTCALRFACASGALAVGKVGPKGLVPTLELVNQFLQSDSSAKQASPS